MIPTAVTNSPSTATAANTSGSSLNSSGSNNGAQQAKSPAVMLGIAALILEGRAISEDEYSGVQVARAKPEATEHALLYLSGASGSGCGRQSPKPSTSRAANTSYGFSGRVINITTNPNAYECATIAPPMDTFNSSSASSSAESLHQRWTQKLCQLRQASPAASLSSTYEQPVAVEAQSSTTEPELVALAINERNPERSEFEIRRRVMLSRANLPTATATTTGSAASSPGSGSENFLYSLQSLATTCLRGGSPSAEATGYRYTPLSSSPLGPSSSSPKYSYRHTPRFPNPYPAHALFNVDLPASSFGGGGGLQSPPSKASMMGAGATLREKFLRQHPQRNPLSATITNSSLHAANITATPTTTTKTTYPQQGPHCDQFLRKMGLAKGETAEAEDHFCDMTYVNITCSRWRAYCLKMEAIIEKGEPICIEVYLGPEGHKILLEQWIITQNNKVPPPTMTLPSLCSAIRSQLYFSQISAWCDMIKKSDKSIYDTGRLIFPKPTGAAGDLVTSTAAAANAPHSANTTPGTSPSSTSSPLSQTPSNNSAHGRPRLNIFYRIKQYDSTARFNSNPNVHNFPNVNISESHSVSVCLKSLPRINGGIPKISTGMQAAASGEPTAANGAANGKHKSVKAVSAATPTSTAGTCRNGTSMSAQSMEKRARSPFGSSASSSACATPSSSSQHKCVFFIDEEELALDEADGADEEDNVSDFTNNSTGDNSSSHGNLSHREKQLMKYRKRMLKRDKKQRKPFSNTSDASCDITNGEQSQLNQDSSSCQPMEQGEEEDNSEPALSQLIKPTKRATSHIEMISTGTQTQMTCCQQCGSEKTLVCLKCCTGGCNTAMEGLLNAELSVEVDDMDDSASSISSSDIIHTPRNSAELLLQSIQRTPKAAKYKKQAAARSAHSLGASCSVPKLQNNNHVNAMPAGDSASNGDSGCRECKRLKTQHNFSNGASNGQQSSFEEGESMADTNAHDDDEDDGKAAQPNGMKTLFRGPDHLNMSPTREVRILEQETFETSTKLTPYIDRCSLNTGRRFTLIQVRIAGDSTTTPSHLPEEDYCEVAAKGPTTQFKTPTNSQPTQSPATYQHKQTPKPNLLQVATHYTNGDSPKQPNSHNPLLMRKGLPKVNLTPLFCNPCATMTPSLSSPIPIVHSTAPNNEFTFDQATIMRAAQLQLPHTSTAPAISSADNSIPVQKSFSAPTLPNSPSLSPRFAKQAAIYKRRSRHLSDRSDRSSLGSDELFSDDDLENGMYSPATSPVKQRFRIGAQFGRAALLGNLEESLFQKRLMPKMEVPGFKVQLGASGGFCPTQVTIPASAFFYELHGESLCTPYVCEVRLPRKGYSVPRFGTVQVTLLNPMGTVVRMFVIPYDMRDMPALHQTFIRQRVLAESDPNSVGDSFANNNNGSRADDNRMQTQDDGNLVNGKGGGDVESSIGRGNLHNNSNNHSRAELNPIGHFISAEHMKRLRYSIHLRFQTSRSGRLSLHSDIRILISRRTDCDTAAAHAKGVLEAPNDLITYTVMPTNPKYSARQESPSKI